MKRFMIGLVAALVGAMPALASHRVGDKAFFLVTFGDSVSHGVWADTTIGKAGPRFYASASAVMAARALAQSLGWGYDHINRETQKAHYFDKIFFLTKRDALSAFTGSQAYSLPARLAQKLGRGVVAKNFGLLAATFPAVWAQFADLERYLRARPGIGHPDLLVLSLGAVDFVRRTEIPLFQAGVVYFFTKFAHDYPDTNLVVTEIWDLVSLVIAMDEVTIPKGGLFKKDIRCADMYAQMRIGELHGIYPGYEGPNVASARAYLDAIKGILATEVRRMARREGPYADYRGQVAEAAAELPPGERRKDTLAIDCFHPSVKGQELLSQSLWQAVEDLP